MQNNLIDQAISEYLQQLKVALKGEDSALIQDAQYDAEEHLRAAMEEESNPQSNDIATFEKVCEDYGSAEEIAQFYCEMEATVDIAFKGNKKSINCIAKNKFFGVLTDAKAYQAMVFMMLALPIGLVYFGWIMIVGLGSLSFSILIIGIPIFLLFLASMQKFSLFEGRLIENLLGQRMPRRPKYQRTHHYANRREEWQAKLQEMVHDKKNWTTALYLLLKFPLGLAQFFAVVAAAMMSIAVMLSPILDPILHYLDPSILIDIEWYWFPIAIPGGLLGLILSLHLAKLAGHFQAWLAKYLLLSIASDD